MGVFLVVDLLVLTILGGCLCQDNSVISEEVDNKFTDEADINYEMEISKLFYERMDVEQRKVYFPSEAFTRARMLLELSKINSTNRINDIFSPFDEYYKSKADIIYSEIMKSGDLKTFYRKALVARSIKNIAEVFIYALYAAVSHSSITKNVQIPPPYIVNPHLFYPAEAIERAAGFLKNECDKVFTNRGKNYKKEKVSSTDVVMTDLDDSSTNSYSGLNRDGALDYFREDVDLNAYYYFYTREDAYFQETNHDNEKRASCRSGEQYYYFHRQLLTRYKMEMLANKLPVEFHDLEKIHDYIQYGYQPALKYRNGAAFPKRTFQFNVSDEFENGQLRFLLNFAVGIQESLDSGYVTMSSGELRSLKKSEDLEFLARLIRANIDQVPYSSKLRRHLGSSDDDKTRRTPSALEQLETTLRDPLFWSLCNQLVEYFTAFKNKLPAYAKDDLDFEGVSIAKLYIDDPINLFEARYQTDISNAINKDKLDEQNYTFVLTQKRTTISHFNIIIKIQSDFSEDATVRLFLTTQLKYNIHESRDLFWEIDAFVHTLDKGSNTIIRNSDHFRHSQPPYDWVLNGNTKLYDDKKVGGFPSGLYLPKNKNGDAMPLYLYAIVTKYDATDEVRMQNCKRSVNKYIVNSSYFIDGKAFGFPFDRRLTDDALSVTNNKVVEWTTQYTIHI